MSNLLIKETWFNHTNGNCIGESNIYESFTNHTGELFRALVKEYGRCIGKVYVDSDQKHVGWSFKKRQQYTDCNDTFIKVTEITVHSAQPKTIIKNNYCNL